MRRNSIVRAVVLVGALIGGLAKAHAFTTLSKAMDQLAENIRKVQMEMPELRGSVALGTFSGTPRLQVASGTGFKEHLRSALEKKGVKLDQDSALVCSGEYFLSDLSIGLEVTLRHGSSVRRFDCKIEDTKDFLHLLGGTGPLPLDDVTKRQEAVKQAVSQPAPILAVSASANETAKPPATSQVKASVDGQYGVEILRMNEGGGFEPLPASARERTEDGKGGKIAFVDGLGPDSIYALRIINRTSHDAAVTITIDGLNLFHFTDINAYRKHGVMIFPPNPEGHLIKGWHKKNDQVFAFHVKELGVLGEKKLAERFGGLNEEIGAVTVSFAVAAKTAEELAQLNDKGSFSGGLFTDAGKLVGQNFTELNRFFGATREVVTIRYSRSLPK